MIHRPCFKLVICLAPKTMFVPDTKTDFISPGVYIVTMILLHDFLIHKILQMLRDFLLTCYESSITIDSPKLSDKLSRKIEVGHTNVSFSFSVGP